MEKMEGDEVAKFNRAQSYKNNKKPFNKPDKFEERICYFCKELKNGKEKTHNTKNCFLRQKNKDKRSAKGFKVDMDDKSSQSSDEDSEEDKMSSLLQKMKTQD